MCEQASNRIQARLRSQVGFGLGRSDAMFSLEDGGRHTIRTEKGGGCEGLVFCLGGRALCDEPGFPLVGGFVFVLISSPQSGMSRPVVRKACGGGREGK